MDSIISSALEEICMQGRGGLPLASLWTRLNADNSLALSPSVKGSIYSRLLKIPSLEFQSDQKGAFDANDAAIQRFEDAEKLGVKIVAGLQLRDSFLGLYDMSINSSGLPASQRSALDYELRALERLAMVRSNGITQSQLAKEFGVEGKNFFYTVRNLECKGLIVRQPAVVKTKEANAEGESKNSSCVTTNLMYLYRYAKHLDSQQRFEISKEGPILESPGNANENAVNGDNIPGERVKEDVHIKDYLPAMKAICDKLEEANGKVLVVSDIKQDLGYSGPPKHKAWRTICRRLKDAGIAEEFDAKVNEKVERCIRLVKGFSSKKIQQNSLGCGDNFENVQEMKFGRRFGKCEQLVELPIEHQIYDMVDAEGSDGLAVMEVCDRLGIDKKKNYSRFSRLVPRFGMHLQAENHKRTVAYRVWTPGNSNSKPSNAFQSKSKVVDSENEIPHLDIIYPDDVSHGPAQTFLEYNHSTSKGDFANLGGKNDMEINTETSAGSLGYDETNHMLPSAEQELLHEASGLDPDRELALVSITMEANTSTPETKHLALSKALMNPSPSLSPNGLRREQSILERLQDEKFILRAELQRWLANLEDKCTAVDRKSIERILVKLQQQGQCKCLDINIPNVTNCGRSRIARVVLHPSIQCLTPDLLNEIHDRLRSFEMQIRGQGSSKGKKNESVPVLDSVQRTQSRLYSDDKAVRSEAMRANGFVLAKMVRAKLLHNFLWDCLSRSPGWDDTLSSGKNAPDLKNPHSSCTLFSLETAIKNIPLELFLQVAGSTQKFDDMIEKCKKGLCLSDLPFQEYRCLMDTKATGKLSLIIDVLRRLKLIRLVSNGHSDNGIETLRASLTHAMELRPYIEEPPPIAVTSNVMLLDLRPRIRHDFFLSTKEAVNEYWKTLEYCYAAADPRAALLAFPGSAVHEVFHYRSWASVRVMTADQRAKLLKRMVKDNIHEKISYKECEKIAKDLNLTLEQVLRVYNDKHQQRFSRFQGVLSSPGKESQPQRNRYSSSQKRKKPLEERLAKNRRVDSATVQLASQRHAMLPVAAKKIVEEHDLHLPRYQEDDHPETLEDPGPSEEELQCCSFSNQHSFSNMKPSRHKRFLWGVEDDRQLVIQYARQRALLGAKFHRVNWASLDNLPASPSACEKRMSSLKRNTKVRKAIMKLCNVLSERYVKHLEKKQNMPLNNNGRKVLVRSLSKEGCNPNTSNGDELADNELFEEKHWDDFDDQNNKRALEEVLQLKQMTNSEASKRVGSTSEDYSINFEDSGLVSSTTYSDQIVVRGQLKDTTRRTKSHLLHQKFLKLLNEGINVNREVESLAVSNAIELLKLVFLSTSTAPELSNLPAETLRRYSEHDLFAAFSYLREKKFMIGGNGNPFVLSQQFLLSLSKSPFPINTGKRAAEFSSWLYERGKDLMEGGIDLNEDLQCGEIFHLFSLVSSGELYISPFLPDEGVGEAEDLRGLKRRNEENDLFDRDKAKKLKFLTEGELVSRREKGFPGIVVSMCRATISMVDAIDLFKDEEACTDEFHGNAELSTILGPKSSGSSCQSDFVKESVKFGSVVPLAGSSNELPWDAMAAYGEYLLRTEPKQVSFFSPQVFKAVYAAIKKAGDQGLSFKEVSQVVNRPGEKILECIIDVLQAFGRALKVNAYDSVRIVGTLYRSKYFLTSMAGFHQDPNAQSLTKILGGTDNSYSGQAEILDADGGNSRGELKMNVGDMHRVTILNLPEDAAETLNETQTSNAEVCMQDAVLPSGNNEGEGYKYSSAESCMPILPWVNGDGTINNFVYNGLLRRVLGMVMQNPGILEGEIICQMDVLNPQSCKKLLELMILDGHLIVRKMNQTVSTGPPAILGNLFGSSFRNSNMGYREHFFANPMSTYLL